ncbi:lipoprotein [Nitratidesulfovibrio vulgaris]|uniref:Lipoprotein, putative n=1 Tax=Nitratidesulfovibrio vulgaris (strain ATCC 29579 / DSM 644 / CCUG 34227 / NCIMB 8303 / VKM B-1760 / Hildenborough) TaxID=882 RepID=Q72DS1_NITV2|nr:lipoprotein [Nitratidesulfovibrio vulgaris]GEB81312.1 lipoprotein [Desulfovibrio desulfuricans]HBW14770.1 lipoprotein [Desulfovibrio sp.]AAS95338.1 lipoprotein, putative [Nitratidesulfovibrio vulgaris str. Hildenborough]ADP85952.1 putative lipoprotein [Nitratidesulfovibrio vulgaris RCH1]WCB47505.1 lipoprotein [Nitratidesulfovibrio vulgaris]
MPRFAAILVAMSTLFILSCASPPRVSVDMDLASQPTFYLDDWVRRGYPQVMVRPEGRPEIPPNALFMPLRVTQQMQHPTLVGTNVSRMVWQTWLQQRVFPVIEFADQATPYRQDIALRLARMKGAQVVVGGYVTYFVEGGTAGDTRVSLQIEILDVASGQLLWSMAHTALLERQFTNDYLLFATKARMPSDPTWAVVQTVSADMGKEVHDWLYPPAPKAPSKPDAFQ